MNDIYNFRLDTSNIENDDDKHVTRQKLIKSSWNNITNYFLEKGERIKIKYWPGDVSNGYSGYGINEIYESDKNALQEMDTHDLLIVNAEINIGVKELIQKSMHEDHVYISPFFHFDIIDEKGISIFSSQDNGDNTLIFLSKKDIASIYDPLIVSLPEI
ncbi:hypothetical protein [Lederbergia panacisoli]|uniref:hypothetical protein n=1 Tax=Lederbergia panacisoli TaxID=1255251 RepID=UPI00214AE80D|nr:hypothetical protein [Lederbergia panacisoli]MCR2822220.1 hypothetical protein [Lederbergia panacisoli]